MMGTGHAPIRPHEGARAEGARSSGRAARSWRRPIAARASSRPPPGPDPSWARQQAIRYMIDPSRDRGAGFSREDAYIVCQRGRRSQISEDPSERAQLDRLGVLAESILRLDARPQEASMHYGSSSFPRLFVSVSTSWRARPKARVESLFVTEHTHIPRAGVRRSGRRPRPKE